MGWENNVENGCHLRKAEPLFLDLRGSILEAWQDFRTERTSWNSRFHLCHPPWLLLLPCLCSWLSRLLWLAVGSSEPRHALFSLHLCAFLTHDKAFLTSYCLTRLHSFFFFFFCMAPRAAQWISQAKDWIRSCSCDLPCSCSNAGSFNSWGQAGNRAHASKATQAAAVGFLTNCTTAGTPRFHSFFFFF